MEEHFSRSARFCQDTPASTRAACFIARPRSYPRGHVLPGEDNLYTATLCYHSLPESIKHHEIQNIKRIRATSDPTEKSGRNVIFLQHTLQFLHTHLENTYLVAIKQHRIRTVLKLLIFQFVFKRREKTSAFIIFDHNYSLLCYSCSACSNITAIDRKSVV